MQIFFQNLLANFQEEKMNNLEIQIGSSVIWSLEKDSDPM